MTDYHLQLFAAFLFMQRSGLTFRVSEGPVPEGGVGYTLHVGPADKAPDHAGEIAQHRESIIRLARAETWTPGFASDMTFASIRYAVRVDERPLGVPYWASLTYPELAERWNRAKAEEHQAMAEERWEDFRRHLFECYELHREMAKKYEAKDAKVADPAQATLF